MRWPRPEIGPDGWPLYRKPRLPTWLRISIRIAALWPFVLLALIGGAAERAAEWIEDYLPRGL